MTLLAAFCNLLPFTLCTVAWCWLLLPKPQHTASRLLHCLLTFYFLCTAAAWCFLSVFLISTCCWLMLSARFCVAAYLTTVFCKLLCWLMLPAADWTQLLSSLVWSLSYILCTKICIRHDNRKQLKHTWSLKYELTYFNVEKQTSAKFLSFLCLWSPAVWYCLLLFEIPPILLSQYSPYCVAECPCRAPLLVFWNCLCAPPQPLMHSRAVWHHCRWFQIRGGRACRWLAGTVIL